jgi:YCII-related domain
MGDRHQTLALRRPNRKDWTMSQFIFSYRSAKSHDAVAGPDGLAAWVAFLNDVIAPNVVDPGWPVFEPAAVLGEAGESTQLGGYSIVTADDLETALSMAEHCPAIKRGGGVEVGVLAALPPEHPAEQIRSSLSRA